MNEKHLDDFLTLDQDVQKIISEYTRIAINYSVNYSPDTFDYDLAYKTIMEKYKNVE